MNTNTRTLSNSLQNSSLVAAQDPPAPAKTVIVKVISGDNRIDPLLDDAAYRFNNGSPVGTAVTVTFSFPTSIPATYTGEDALGWQPFSEQQKTATREILAELQQQTLITFQEVDESTNSAGTMRFSNNTQQNSSGYAFLPNSTQSENDSDVFIAIGSDTNVERGTAAWGTLVHEIGHAVGLNHPGNYNAGETSSNDAVGNFLGVEEDAFFNSIMSYRWSAQDLQSVWFMPYDMLALRYLYGTNPVATGNNTYTYSDASGRQIENLVDNGGNDTLDFSAVTAGIMLDLTPGAYSSVGKLVSGANALANLTTSFDALIENAIGTVTADTMFGNAANNRLTGGLGNDTLDGRAGIDTAVFSAQKANYAVVKGTNGWTVGDSAGTDGNDALTNVERLQFSDKKFALDLGATENGGLALQFIGLMAPAMVSLPNIVGTILTIFDEGKTMQQVCQMAIDVGLVNAIAGANTNQALAAMAYKNLLGVQGGADVVDMLVGYMDGRSANYTQSEFMTVVAGLELNQTHIGLVGLAQTGVEYV